MRTPAGAQAPGEGGRHRNRWAEPTGRGRHPSDHVAGGEAVSPAERDREAVLPGPVGVGLASVAG